MKDQIVEGSSCIGCKIERSCSSRLERRLDDWHGKTGCQGKTLPVALRVASDQVTTGIARRPRLIAVHWRGFDRSSWNEIPQKHQLRAAVTICRSQNNVVNEFMQVCKQTGNRILQRQLGKLPGPAPIDTLRLRSATKSYNRFLSIVVPQVQARESH